MDLADTRGDLIGRPWHADERPPGLDATEREPCRIEAAAPRAGQYARDGDFARAERLADLPCLLTARLGQVALGRAVLDPEAGGIPERADRARVAEHDDLTASAQERPQGLVVGDGGAGGRQDQHRAREDHPPPDREGVSTIWPNCLPSASRADAAAPSLSGTTSSRIALEPAREEQSHHVVELAPVGHRGADDVDLLPEHERDERLAVRSRGGAARDEPAAALERPDRVLPGGRAHVFEDDVDAALVGGVEDRLRPLGIRRVVDAERRQDKSPGNGTSVLGTPRRPLPAPPVQRGQPVCHRSFSQNGALVQRHGPAPNTPSEQTSAIAASWCPQAPGAEGRGMNKRAGRGRPMTSALEYRDLGRIDPALQGTSRRV